jgi:DNA polymerase-3 subunit delta'
MIFGQDHAVAQFAGAWAQRKLHHAWLLAGPRGVGKATFSRAAARRVLSDAAGPPCGLPGLQSPDDHRVVKLIAAGSHPDMRWLERLPKERGEGLARNISVDQVRTLGEFMGMTPALSDWRVVVIDTVDELEASGANALLKILEEPPPNTIFFLVSHAPGRLLPTIRSRCRRLDFQTLSDDVMASILSAQLAEQSAPDRARIISAAAGSAARAVALASLDLAKLEEKATRILRDGDPTNAYRSELATELGKKGAAERYAAFLELVPSIVAREARQLPGGARERALDAYSRTRELSAIAPRLSLDPAATVFQLGGILSSVARPVP